MKVKNIMWSFVLTFAFITGAQAATIELNDYLLVGGNSFGISDISQGQRWQIGNNLIDPITSCEDGYTLAVGDMVRIRLVFSSALLISDNTNRNELVRFFMLRYRELALDVSSIVTTTAAIFYNNAGTPIAYLSEPASRPVDLYDMANYVPYGLDSILGGDVVSMGHDVEISSILFEMSILSDPNSLLLTSEFPWVSFALDADTIQYGSPNPAFPNPVPEPATMFLFSLGLVGLIGLKRGHRNQS